MRPEDAKSLIKNVLGSPITFDGHFGKCFEHLKETQQQELLAWIQDCKARKTNPLQSKTNRELIGFVRRIGSNLRAILTKKKRGYFLVLFLDKHKYYETEMQKLGF
ncbi:MAG: hypothetical protein V1725_08200 [archaeon]